MGLQIWYAFLTWPPLHLFISFHCSIPHIAAHFRGFFFIRMDDEVQQVIFCKAMAMTTIVSNLTLQEDDAICVCVQDHEVVFSLYVLF